MRVISFANPTRFYTVIYRVFIFTNDEVSFGFVATIFALFGGRRLINALNGEVKSAQITSM